MGAKAPNPAPKDRPKPEPSPPPPPVKPSLLSTLSADQINRFVVEIDHIQRQVRRAKEGYFATAGMGLYVVFSAPGAEQDLEELKSLLQQLTRGK